MKLFNSTLDRGTTQLSRDKANNLSRENANLSRKTRLKSKPYKRTKQQEEYREVHAMCEIETCSEPSMPTPHHIDSAKNREDNPLNEFGLCWWHHVSPISVHVVGIATFCEAHGLADHPKWKAVYARAKDRMELYDRRAG